MDYGLLYPGHAADIAVAVAKAFGNSQRVALMIMETGCAESLLGNAHDRHPERLGVSWLQIDQIALDDVKQRTRDDYVKIMLDHFGYELSCILLEDLAYDPLLATIICRMHYRLVPELFPDTLWERGVYWKKHYNKSGAGSPEEYVVRVQGITFNLTW